MFKFVALLLIYIFDQGIEKLQPQWCNFLLFGKRKFAFCGREGVLVVAYF